MGIKNERHYGELSFNKDETKKLGEEKLSYTDDLGMLRHRDKR